MLYTKNTFIFFVVKTKYSNICFLWEKRQEPNEEPWIVQRVHPEKHSHLTGWAVMAAVGFDDLAVVAVSDG